MTCRSLFNFPRILSLAINLPKMHRYLQLEGCNLFSKVGSADDQTGIPDGWLGLDIGPASVIANAERIAQAKTIVWNG